MKRLTFAMELAAAAGIVFGAHVYSADIDNKLNQEGISLLSQGKPCAETLKLKTIFGDTRSFNITDCTKEGEDIDVTYTANVFGKEGVGHHHTNMLVHNHHG